MSQPAKILHFPGNLAPSARPVSSRPKRRRNARLVAGRFKIGSLYRQPSGCWAARVTDLTTGETFKKSSGCPTKSDALPALQAILERMETKEEQASCGSLSLSAAVADFLATKDLSPASQRDYRRSFDTLAERFGAESPLTATTYEAVESYTSALVKAGRRRTAQKHLVLLRSFLRWSVRRGWLERDPTEGLKPPRQETKEFRLPTPEEAREFLNACGESYLRKAAALGFLTGLRLGTILSLRASDLDVEAGVIRVDKSRMKARRGIEVPVRTDLLALLLNGLPTDPDAALIGRRVTTIKKSFDAARKHADMPWFVFHSTRRWFASQLAATGCSYTALKELLGHSAGSDVTRIYVQVSAEEKAEAVAALPAIL